ncbi:hypothetical protein Hanom_Chr09g00796361 [Helianthus anomalus]
MVSDSPKLILLTGVIVRTLSCLINQYHKSVHVSKKNPTNSSFLYEPTNWSSITISKIHIRHEYSKHLHFKLNNTNDPTKSLNTTFLVKFLAPSTLSLPIRRPLHQEPAG